MKKKKDEKAQETVQNEIKTIPEELDIKIIDLTNELEAQKDKYLRLFAEFDNYKKRSLKEKEALYNDCVSDCVKEILPILDSLERAINTNGDYETLKKGLDMVLKQMEYSLDTLGVQEIDTSIEFDPNLHNAVMHIEDENLGEGVIIETMQKGYKAKDKVIRYAMVKVAN